MPSRNLSRVSHHEPDTPWISKPNENAINDSYLDELVTFGDVSSTHWAYYQILEASNGHLYAKNEDGTETWTELK